MARFARVGMPGLPHRVARRGNRRQPAFFTEDDDRADRACCTLVAAALGKPGVARRA